MHGALTLVAIGLGLAVTLLALYDLTMWLGRQRTLRIAEQITHKFASEWSLGRARPALRLKLENYRRAKALARTGASNSLHAAATKLVREHRRHALKRR